MGYSIYLRDGSNFVIEPKNLKKLDVIAQSKGPYSVGEYFGEYDFRLEIRKGKVEGILFDGDRMSDDIPIFLKEIAPFVKAGSYIEMEGEDGGIWRWVFDGKTMKEIDGKVVFE